MSEQPQVQVDLVSVGLINPSPTNPRKKFDEKDLHELHLSILTHGVLQPILVRPRWCVGWDGKVDNEPIQKNDAPFEIIAGERRWRAGALAGLVQMPCLVRPLGDMDALELQLIENLQRQDLSPIEEAEGFRAMLDLRDEHGEPRYTVEGLAEKLGCTKQNIYRAQKLLNLPEAARKALENGEIPVSVAEVIGSVPSEEAREAAAKDILKPEYQDESLSYRDAVALVRDRYSVSLKTADFNPKDPDLLPAAGPCDMCPKRSGNTEDASGRAVGDSHGGSRSGTRGDMCTDVTCFKLKRAAAWQKFQASETKPEKNRRALTEKENEKVFSRWGADGELDYNTPYVKLREHPEEDLLAKGKDPEKVGTWRELVKDSNIEVVVARTKSGKVVELVDRKTAIEAARLKPEYAKVFKDGSEKKGTREEEEQEQKESARKRDFAKRLEARIAGKLVGIAEKGLTLPQWRAVAERLVSNVCEQSDINETFIRRGLSDEDDARKLGSVVQSLSEKGIQGFLVDMAWCNARTWENEIEPEAVAFAKAFGIDPKAEARALAAEDKEAAKAAKPDPKAEAAKVLGGRTFTFDKKKQVFNWPAKHEDFGALEDAWALGFMCGRHPNEWEIRKATPGGLVAVFYNRTTLEFRDCNAPITKAWIGCFNAGKSAGLEPRVLIKSDVPDLGDLSTYEADKVMDADVPQEEKAQKPKAKAAKKSAAAKTKQPAKKAGKKGKK